MKRAGRPSSSVPPRDPRTATRGGAFVDPLEIAFAAAQQAYKAGLYALVNAKRRARELAPVEWPTVGGSRHDEVWRDGAARLLRYRAADAAPDAAHPAAPRGAHPAAPRGAHPAAPRG